MDAVVKKLVQIRLKKGVSQNRLAELSGLSRSGIRHFESGDTNPTLYFLLKIGKALEVNVGRIVIANPHR